MLNPLDASWSFGLRVAGVMIAVILLVGLLRRRRSLDRAGQAAGRFDRRYWVMVVVEVGALYLVGAVLALLGLAGFLVGVAGGSAGAIAGGRGRVGRGAVGSEAGPDTLSKVGNARLRAATGWRILHSGYGCASARIGFRVMVRVVPVQLVRQV
jgi:hypothetical protein